MNLFNVLIKRFLKNMYLNKDIQKNKSRKKIIKKLFLYVNKNPKISFLLRI